MNKIISFILVITTLMSCMIFSSSAAKIGDLKDINENTENYEAIKWVVDNGYMQGTSGDEFSPDMTLTRAQFATLIARYAGAELTSYEGERAFSDVPVSSWYASACAWAKDKGIMNGTGDGRFSPHSIITRQEIAILFKNYADFTGTMLEKLVPETRLMDRGSNKAASWAKDGISFAYKTLILPLDENDCFAPTHKMTRSDAAAALYAFQNAVDRIHEKREKKVVAYYNLDGYANHKELKDVDILNVHPIKAYGDGYIDQSKLNKIETLKTSALQYNPDLKFVLTIPVNSGADIEKWMDSYADCDDFADAAVDIVRRYDLDGVDFDYEFPTGNLPQKNLHYFLDALREKMNALGTGKDYIVSMAIAGGSWSFTLFQDLGELQHHLDYFNFMDYDLRSEAPWPTTYNHCAPYDSIYPNASTYSDVVLSLEAGVQREKIILGCGMYTQDWDSVATSSTVGIYVSAHPNNAAPTYYNVYRNWVNYDMLDAGTPMPSNNGYYPHWDDTAKALSFYNPHTRKFMSGDDDRSVEEKCKMVVADNLGGLMFFDYTFTAGARDWLGMEVKLFEKTQSWLQNENT
ncbi:MAG: hypothetical protein E7652_05125 [Ruminococcaceae bacterium]|nr:hypothetical protein [Oscillospiraceae bacterium]